MRHEERIIRLERDLAKLEGIVESVVNGMAAEHQVMRENRQEDRKALKELGDKMERSVATLAAEIKTLAEKGASIDSQVLAKQSQALGALAFGRWVVGTVIAFAAIMIAYQSGRNNELRNLREPVAVPQVIK